jgi:hypothetical protein
MVSKFGSLVLIKVRCSLSVLIHYPVCGGGEKGVRTVM